MPFGEKNLSYGITKNYQSDPQLIDHVLMLNDLTTAQRIRNELVNDAWQIVYFF